MPKSLSKIQQGRYVSLATYRNNGAKVATPVWMAPAVDQQPAQDFYIFSAGNAGKVTRLRNNSDVELALCDVRGTLASDWCTGTAELVVDAASIQNALAALRSKYGWQMWLADVGAQLTGKFSKRAYIRVRFTPP